MKKLIILFLVIASFVQAQNREQQIGIPRAKKYSNVQIIGTVTSLETSQPVPNAEINIREIQTQNLIADTKSDANGKYSVLVPRGIELDMKVQAPQYFYVAERLNLPIDGMEKTMTQDFQLPSELSLRLNFPTNKHDDPYKFILDENGEQTIQSWQDALEQVAEDLIKYEEYIKMINLVGHTDDVGASDYNLKLGQRRVEFVRDELIKRGVNAEIMEVSSAGKNQLLEKRAGEDDDSWRKRCRRVSLNKVMKK